MSHCVTIKTQFKNLDALERVCKSRGVAFERAKAGKTLTREFYGSQTADGVAAFKLPGWQYPVVVDAQGQARLDNYNGQWGKQSVFDEFNQAYAKDIVLDQLRSDGFRLSEETVEQDGTIQMVLTN